MRLALLTNNFPPILDGVGDYSCQLINELQQRGHCVSVICQRESTIQRASQANAFSFPVASTVPAWNWRAIRPIRQFLAQQQPDWLLLQYVPNSFQRWAMPFWLVLLVWFVKRRSVRICITFHEVSIRGVKWPLKYALVSLFQRLIARLLVRLADASSTSIDLYANQLRTYTSKPVQLIPIGSNISGDALSINKQKIIKQQLAPRGERLISTFGLRNQDLLLRVFDQLVQHDERINLLIIGQLTLSISTQPIYDRLRQQIHVTGFLPSQDVYAHLAASDVFFIPDPVLANGEGGSSSKSASLAAGLAAGLPVVGTKGDMNNTLLRQTPGVYLEDHKDINRLVNRLLTILSTNSTKRQQAILTFFRQKLSWPVIADQYLAVLTN